MPDSSTKNLSGKFVLESVIKQLKKSKRMETKMKLERIYGKKKAIGYWADNAFHGFVVMDVLHGIDEYLVTCETMNGKRIRYAKNKVFETISGKYYIRKFNRRIYLTEIIRT